MNIEVQLNSHPSASDTSASFAIKKEILRKAHEFRNSLGLTGPDLWVCLRDYLADSGREVAIPLLAQFGIKPDCTPTKLAPGPKVTLQKSVVSRRSKRLQKSQPRKQGSPRLAPINRPLIASNCARLKSNRPIAA